MEEDMCNTNDSDSEIDHDNIIKSDLSYLGKTYIANDLNLTFYSGFEIDQQYEVYIGDCIKVIVDTDNKTNNNKSKDYSIDKSYAYCQILSIFTNNSNFESIDKDTKLEVRWFYRDHELIEDLVSKNKKRKQ